ncbi:TPA: phage tail spike protein [Streptococcus suis]
MISVFPSTAYTKSELAGVGYPILNLWCESAKLYIRQNGHQYIKLVIPHRAKGIDVSLLPKELQIIKIHDIDGKEDYYRVRKPQHNLKYTTIYAEHITYDLNDNLIEDIFIVNSDGQQALDKISKSTQYPHPFDLRSDIDSVRNLRLVRVNPMQAILGTEDNTFVNRFGGEVKRQGFTISVNKRVGVDRTDVIRSGKNLTGFEANYDFNDVATRIMPKGPNGILLPEKYVDSPLINHYPIPFIRVIDYKVEYEGNFDDLPQTEKNRVYNELRELAKADFKKGVDVPSATYKVNFVSLRNTIEYRDYEALENIGIGDLQPVYEARYDIEIKGRVTDVVWDLLNKNYESITLGNFRDGIVQSTITSQRTAEKRATEAQETANLALRSADGKATNYYGNDEPSNPSEGDLWYKKNGQEDEIWQYQLVDGKLQWVYVTGTLYINELKDRVSKDFEKLNTEIKKQEEAQARQIADVLAKANANANLISVAQQVANQAKSDAANALASATQLKADAVNEAQKLVNTLKTETVASSNQLKQQIETVGNQLSSQQAELLQATQTVRGLDTQVKSVANQLGTQQTTITQLVNDGNARGQKIADFETSLDGVTTKLQNLWNGSRNLLSNTELLTGYEGVLPYPKNHYLNKAVFRWTHKATDTAFKEGLVMQVNDTLVNPKEMIVSFYAVANRSTTIRCYMFNPNGRKAVETSTGYTATNVDGYAEVTIGTAWRRYWVRYTYQVGYVAKPYVIIGRSPDTVTADSTVSIVAPALYHGHYNRDWQPSDVDIVSDFAIYKQTIDQNLAQLGSDIRTANGSVTSLRTEYNQTKTEIALLASKSDFDALTQKTQSLEASLKVQAGKIDLKAEKASIDSINQQISSAQAELTVVNDAIAQRVTKTDFNAVKRTAEANATAITQVNNAIELKAEKTYVDGIKSTADNAMSKANANANTITQTKAELKIVSDAIETKATKTDLNNLTGRMSTAETTIRTQAGQIEQRLTATQVNELIDGKGYATSSSVQNLVKETSDSFSRTISETKALIPTEVGGRNYLLNSKTEISGGWGSKVISLSPKLLDNLNKIKSVTISCDVEGTNVATKNSRKRYGLACSVEINGIVNYWEVWQAEDTIKKRISQTFTVPEGKTITKFYSPTLWIQADGNVKVSNPKLEFGVLPTDWSPAPEDLATVTALHSVRDTVDSHTRTIGAVGTAGSILDNVSKVTQTAAGLVQEVSGTNGLKTQVSQLAGSYAIKNLTNSGTVLNQLNLNKDGSVKIDGKLVQITGTTYIQDGVITSAKIAGLDAGKINTGELNAARIKANSIDGSKIVFDQAFVNKMTANEAVFKQLFAQNAFITSVQSTDISANLISGGVLKSTNGATNFDLNNGNLLFNNNYGYIRRTANDKIFEITTLLTEKSNYSPEGLSSKFMIRKSDSSRQSGVSFNLYTTVDGKPTATARIYSDFFTITSSDYTTLFSLGSKKSYLGTLNLQDWGDIPVATMSGGLVVKDIGIGGHTESLLKVVERLCTKTGLIWI